MTPQERTDAQIALGLRDWLAQGVNELPDGDQLPRGIRDQIITQLPTTPQRRRWWTDRWSTRGRGVMRSDDGPGDRESWRSRRMHGFAALLAAGTIGGAALLAGVNEQEQEPAGRAIVVAQDGSGDVATITEGVALAVDGDTVLVRPGVYPERVVITADITLQGDGPREEVIVEGTAGLDDVTEVDGPYSFVLRDSGATIAGLTVRGMAGGMVVLGGSPTLEDLAFEGTGVPYDSPASCADERGCGISLLITFGSTATVRNNLFAGGGEFQVNVNAEPLIEGNELRDGPHLYLADSGDEAVVRNNTISGTFDRAIGIFSPTTMLIEDNEIIAAGGDGITIGWSYSAGVDPVIRGNSITGSGLAINVQNQASPRLEANVLVDNVNGISATNTKAIVVDNAIRGGGYGIALFSGGTPTIAGNDIQRTQTGLMMQGPLLPFTGNRFCENGQDLLVSGQAEPLPEGNLTCDAESSTAP
jgi:nitrous oxidase accessory protein NosD